MINKSSSEVTLDSVPIVREFPYVFSKDLSSLPLDQELEFEIEKLSGSTPISIPSYRMTPIEVKTLKIQLQDLVDKGFI